MKKIWSGKYSVIDPFDVKVGINEHIVVLLSY